MVILTELMRFGYLGKKPLIKGKKCVTPLKDFGIHLTKPVAVINKKTNCPFYIIICFE